MEKSLNLLVEKLKAAAGPNLKSVVLYGSAARGEFHPKHSDLNVLCVLNQLDAASLENLRLPSAWWEQQGHPAPLVFTLEELRSSADVFAIELLDIRSDRCVLFGEDVFADLEVPRHLHALQVERELRTNLVRLRQAYLRAPRSNAALLNLLDASLGSFHTLFRHALQVLGAEGHGSSREVVDRLAARVGFDAAPFHSLHDLREGARSHARVNVSTVFANYLAAVTRVTEAVDRHLGASAEAPHKS
jgi:predicted nucleotidyltransferase